MPEHESKCGVAGLAITRAAGASAGEEVCSHGRVVDGHVEECVEGLGVLYCPMGCGRGSDIFRWGAELCILGDCAGVLSGTCWSCNHLWSCWPP